nr:MAG TPA: hypothetical protein [Caudoviricetes sp.]
MKVAIVSAEDSGHIASILAKNIEVLADKMAGLNIDEEPIDIIFDTKNPREEMNLKNKQEFREFVKSKGEKHCG